MKKECKDHLGNHFHSIIEMCDYYNISPQTYRAWKKHGYTISEILSSQHHRGFHTSSDVKYYDHLGNGYKSKKEMCEHYQINVDVFTRRLTRGLSLKDALTISKSELYSKACHKRGQNCHQWTDHQGNTYKSMTDMASAFGIPFDRLRYRIKKGWTLEKALNTPYINPSGCNLCKQCTDHKGLSYRSISEMANAYGLKPSIVIRRINDGWSTEEALTIPRNMYIGEYRVAECLKRLNVKFYHDYTIKTIFTDLGISVDWNNFLSELQSHLNSAGYNWSKKKIQNLRPDFVLYTDEDNKIRGVIEFDGEQHQNFIEFFFKTIEEFFRRSDTDFVKQNFWEYMNIPMLRIRHDQINMIDNMVQDFINNPQNYIYNHNTYLSEKEYWSILTEQKQQIELIFAA